MTERVDALLVSEVAADGARSVVVDTEDPVYPVFVFADADGSATVIGWSSDELPRDNMPMITALMKAHDTAIAVFVCEVVLAFDDVLTGELTMCDGAAVVTADHDEYFTRMFVIDRSKPLGDDERFVEYMSEQDGGGLDHSWLQRALAQSRQ
jgi:hypothetical protein